MPNRPNRTPRHAAALAVLALALSGSGVALAVPAFAAGGAPLLVNATPPTVTTDPQTQTVASGGTATFTAAATGEPAPSVQWQFSPDQGATWTDISGATGTSLQVSDVTYGQTGSADRVYGQTGSMYRAVFTNASGTAESTPANLIVNPTAPAVTVDPVAQTAHAGDSVTFTTDATGDPSPNITWEVSYDGGQTWGSAGGYGKTYTFIATTAANGSLYRAEVGNAAGQTRTPAVPLTVLAAKPTVTLQPADQTVEEAPAFVTFTADASGDPTPTVQWQVSTDGGTTFADLDSEVGKTLYVPASPDGNGNLYRAAFSNYGGTVTTNPARLTVTSAAQLTAPQVTAQPADQAVPQGDTATFTASADGQPTPTIQWQLSTDGGATYADIPGATSGSYTTAATQATDDGNLYRAVFTNSVGTAATDIAQLAVNIAPTSATGPTVPRNVTARQTGTGQITVTWDAPADTATPVSSYSVGYGNGAWGNGGSYPSTARSAVFNGLSPGAYTAAVTAVGTDGSSPTVTMPVTVSDAFHRTPDAPATPGSSAPAPGGSTPSNGPAVGSTPSNGSTPGNGPAVGSITSDKLPYTGADAQAEVETAAALLGLGGVLRLSARRRRQRRSTG